jgi:DNA polymerase-3 subunit epsilon
MNFTALDFETANTHRTSICAVGMAIVENGKIVKTVSKLIKPLPDFYSYWNMQVHGISPEMTKDAPYFIDVWNELKEYIDRTTLVAHNAAFDVGVLRSVLSAHEVSYPKTDYFCSCSVSRKVFKEIENHKLSTVCRHMNVPLNHHEAESDAIGAAHIIIKAGERLGVNSIEELMAALKMKLKVF